MEIELDSSLLTAKHREDLVLLALCAFGFTERHRVLPKARAVWDEWAKNLPPDLRMEVTLAWDESEGRALRGTASERVVVVPAGPEHYDQVPIRITPREALGLLGRPLRIFLENGRNDRGFLLAFADAATQAALLKAERAGWLVFETAGGITELNVRLGVATTVKRESREVFRTMYLCDSDACKPGDPSTIAKKIMDGLNDLGLLYRRAPSHFGAVLGRRAAENYAPPEEVVTWASSGFDRAAEMHEKFMTSHGRGELTTDPGARNSPKRHFLAALALRELNQVPDVRGHLDMKEGRFHKNPPPEPDVVRTVDDIWNQLDSFQQAALMDGFGKTFSAKFYEGKSGLSDETNEVTGMLEKIMERL